MKPKAPRKMPKVCVATICRAMRRRTTGVPLTARLEDHLARCSPCQAWVAEVKRTSKGRMQFAMDLFLLLVERGAIT